MKKSKALKVSALAMVIIIMITCFAMPVNASMVFPDLTPEHWCYSKIIDFEERGYVCGYEDGTFRPDQTITRAEYTKIVNNFFGYEPEYEKDSGLKDVNSGDWFYPYVNEAVERGYITGYEDGTFRPEEPIRRQEATVILSRILEIDEEEYPANHADGLAQYPDGDEVEDWARVAIHSYSVYNFINGYEDGYLRILQDVTRAETVELLHILEQQIVIPDPKPNTGGGGGGGGSFSRAATPTITPYEYSGDDQNKELVKVVGWVNSDTAYQNGSLIEITSATNGATISYTLDGWQTTNTYTDKFVLTDGVYTMKAYSTKSGMTKSWEAAGSVKVDTVPPRVSGIQNGAEVTVNVADYDYYNVGTNNISGLSGDSLKYAWFTSGDGDYVRETVWTSFENGATLVAPEYPGVYYLGVMGSDVAENKIGTGLFEEVPEVDDNVDFPNTDGDDEPTDEPFVIVTEITTEEPAPGETTPTEKEEIIEVVVNSTVTITHDFDDDRYDFDPSGDITLQVEVKPGEKYSVEALDSGDEQYAFVKNYDVVAAPKEITVSRNSGDASNKVTIEYKRIKVKVTFDPNGPDTEIAGDEMNAIENIPAGTTVTLPENTYTRVGHDFAGTWSGDNGKTYVDSGDFVADPLYRNVTLSAMWNVKSYEVKLIAGEYIDGVKLSNAGSYDNEVTETVEYGSTVEIFAELASRAGYSTSFDKWSGDLTGITDLNKNIKNTSFTMPAGNVVLEAIGTESVNANTPYRVEYYKEKLNVVTDFNLSNSEFEEFIDSNFDLVAEDSHNSAGVTNKEADYNELSYVGFTLEKTIPSDKTIKGDGSLVIKLFYSRNSYELNIVAGSYMDAVAISGEAVTTGVFEYGQEITISGDVTTGVGADYVFDKWTVEKVVSNANFEFKPGKLTQTITMPATNLTLTANAEKIDVELSDIKIVNFTGSGDNGKKSPEPGDEITYKITVTNKSDDDDAIVKLLLSVKESGDITSSKEVTVDFSKTKKDTIEITFTAKSDPNFPVNKEFGVKAIAKSDSKTANGTILATETSDKNIEKLAGINYKQKTNKNIVMLIDVSSSMAFCTEHPESSKGKPFYGYIVLSGDVRTGRYTGEYDEVDNMGNLLDYDESGDTVFLNGDIIMDYNQTAAGSWKGHTYDLSSSGESNRCIAPSRMDVLIESLIAENTGFIDRLKKGAEDNEESISITLVTFSGYFKNDDGHDVVGPDGKLIPMAEVVGTFGIDDDNLKDEVERIKYSLHTNTELNTGLEKIVELFEDENNKLIKDNAENYFIFFGDGLIGDLSKPEVEYRTEMLEGLITDESAKFDYSYAIGFGKDFDSPNPLNPSSGETVLRTMLKPGDDPIKANTSGDIVEAFASIARDIAKTEQTVNGKLSLKGDSFDDAVEADAVAPIAILSDDEVLLVIEANEIPNSTSTIVATWEDGVTTTEVTFNYSGNTLKEIVIDLSGTAFSNKEKLSVDLNYKAKKPTTDPVSE